MPTTKPEPARVHAALDALTFWRHLVTQPAGPKPWNDTGPLYGAEGDSNEASRRRRYLASVDQVRKAFEAQLAELSEPEPEPEPKRSRTKPPKAEPVKVEMTDDGYAEVQNQAVDERIAELQSEVKAS